MHHVMFDIDGTLVQSMKLDSECYVEAVNNVLGIIIYNDWSKYKYVTDAGILNEVLDLIGYEGEKKGIEYRVKNEFLRLIKKAARLNPINQIEGASDFIEKLQKINGVTLSLATGGWRETALFKLKSANIDVSGISLSSSNDHYDRIEIMKLSLSNSCKSLVGTVTYFGDGEWDKDACSNLGYNFVLIGNKLDHHKQIENFKDIDVAIECIGL